MRVPLSWLKEYVDVPADPGALVERLTRAGLEAAAVRVYGLPVPPTLRVKPDEAGLVWDRDKLVVAKVLAITKHPDAEKLKLVQLDYGHKQPKQVVTGAENIAPGQSGMKVVLGLCGSRYFFTGKDGQKTILTLEPRKLRGIENDAMCMSEFELGIAEESAGIILLDESDGEPGTPIQDVLGEIVIEFDILPNMARCLSMLGMAQEVAALTGGRVRQPDPHVPTAAEAIDGQVHVVITDDRLCRRYAAMIVRNVSVRPAPRWMRSRLHYAGMRPINNIVDITNYVMLEYGQPLHAFDYDILRQRAGGKAPTIIVRPAQPGEKLRTLDGQDRELSPENLVIADSAGPIALAGVMGGAETEVTATTRNVLLESACFDFVSIRKTARQFNLFSEASSRFSRGVPPELVPIAAQRAAQLLHTQAAGTVLRGMVDAYPAPLVPAVIDLTAAEIRRLLGFDIPGPEVVRILEALQFQVQPQGDDHWKVTPPPTRLDIQAGAADLIEELARVYGYDQLPERLLPFELPPPTGNRSLELEERVRDILADLGLQEAITYALTSPEMERRLTPVITNGEFVTLVNPVSPERSVLRRSLLPGLLSVVQHNLDHTDSVAMFELGLVYLPQAAEPLPAEPRRLALVVCGRRTPAAWDDPQGVVPPAYDFYDLKGFVEALCGDLHLADTSFVAVQSVPWLHPMRAAALTLAGSVVGHLGQLHPKVAEAFGFAERAVLAAEFDLEAILAAVPRRSSYRPFSPFPPAKRDIAVVVPETTTAEQVLAEIRAAGGELLSAAALFDVYRGPGLPPGTKSLAFALTYQSHKGTLSDKDIAKAHEKIEGRLRHVLKAQIRGKDWV
ncbi:MAG: phenylalanine--tRNA ligase subunit beta [Gemmataceae bacterium]|nr:phenylalanine--tRNA ligase subunit beta [Gemmata sp.]MDW8196391.1 phenylalanine--tRNA ligase subunit beta [Gemmataceae bacterium]